MPTPTITPGRIAELTRDAAGAACGYTVEPDPDDYDGTESPCGRPATGHRWYQDVQNHDDAIGPACDEHANEGGRIIAGLLAEIAALRERAKSVESAAYRRAAALIREACGITKSTLAEAVESLIAAGAT